MENSLADLNILALDCQTTGATPGTGHLLEIGWINTRASALKHTSDLIAESYLLNLPPEVQIPRSVMRITGISREDLSAAVALREVWTKLTLAARQVAVANRFARCPTVIHFSRFEEPFLRELHLKNAANLSFPLQIICTHEISKHLLPGLPRKGLRAVAGYFGHSVPEFRRSADHAVATAFIWKIVVELLKTERGSTSLKQLMEWLTSKPPILNSGRFYPMEPEARLKLPNGPGIYRMRRINGDLLYIGKAKSIKQRVDSYFRSSGSQAEHILEMLTQAHRLDFTLSGSALEAAILESDAIKRHSPPYNVALRRRQRRLVFCSKDLKQQAAEADAVHSIGPLPFGSTVEALAAFAAWLDNGFRAEDEGFAKTAYTLLGLPGEYAPEISCLQEGSDIFFKKHQALLRPQSPLRTLTMIGFLLRREQLVTPERGEADEDGLNKGEQTGCPSTAGTGGYNWNAEAVAHAIESKIRHGAHLIRRCRWLCLLSESSLAWESPQAGNDHKIMVVFEGGAAVCRQILKAEERLWVPRGHVKKIRERQASFDLSTYDRLRVVTTELRRLVSEKRRIELCFGPKTVIGRIELEKALRWV
jgi:DNA polymerase-3 subunit epsilon